MTNARVVISGNWSSSPIQNQLYFARANAVWPDDFIQLAQLIETDWIGTGSTGIRQRITSLMRWTSIEVYNLDLPFAGAIVRPINIVGARTGNLTQAFPHDCVLIYKECFAGGRRGRGRLYMSGIDPATWNTAIMSAIESTNWSVTLVDLENRWLEPNPTTGWKMILVTAGENPADPLEVKALIHSTKPGTQVRRQIR